MHPWLTYLLAVICISLVPSSYAVDGITIKLDAFDSEPLFLKNVDIDVKLTLTGLTLTAKSKQLVLPDPVGKINNIDFSCKNITFHADEVSCKQGVLKFSQKDLGRQELKTSLTFVAHAETYRASIDNLSYADAKLSVNLNLEQGDWQVSASSDSVDLSKLKSAIQAYLPRDIVQQLSAWQFEAASGLHLTATGNEASIQTANVQASIHDLTLSDEQGLFVTDSVDMALELELNKSLQTWNYKTKIDFLNGEAYGEPVFIDFKQTPVVIDATGSFDQHWNINNKTKVEQLNVVDAQLTYQGTSKFDGALSLKTNSTDLGVIYTHWLQPFLLESAWTDLELAGEVAVELQRFKQNLSVSVAFDDVYIDDQQNRFGVDKLNGQFAWSSFNEEKETALEWQGGYIYAMPFGQSHINATSHDNQFLLTNDWRLPLLDGALQLNNFHFSYNDTDDMSWSFDGLLTPISMGELSTTLEWPIMNGKLSGVIPNVSYLNHQITVDGALMVKVFDGTTVIRDLRLSDPFGALPSLEANLDITMLDLETLTSTFDFGKITGKLNGQVHQLRMVNWEPVAFDADFYTPDGDKSRRRISQQAVNNLSQVSGGASALLSKSFLRFFEDFSYKQLGLSCKLTNEVCEMDGIKPAKQGYYIVEGGGFPPRINVVGYTRRVNWPDLVSRLKSVTNSEGPIIE
jgi:hypothetical protein